MDYFRTTTTTTHYNFTHLRETGKEKEGQSAAGQQTTNDLVHWDAMQGMTQAF